MLVKPLNSPSVGWVITTPSSSKILPPPTGMSAVVVSPWPEPPAEPAGLLGDDPPGEEPAPSDAVLGSSPPQAARKGTPTPRPTAPASACRRLRQAHARPPAAASGVSGRLVTRACVVTIEILSEGRVVEVHTTQPGAGRNRPKP